MKDQKTIVHLLSGGIGCESVDGTGWFRDPSRQDKLPAVERFIKGHRNKSRLLFKIK